MGDEDGAQTGHQQDTGRAAGILVAVHTPDPADRAVAADILRQNGAREVEETDGTWADGEWLDFDPKLKPSSEARPASPQ
jgi:hypothetical protein